MSGRAYIEEYNANVLRNIRIKCVLQHTSIPKIEKALGYGNGAISAWAKAKRLAPADRIAAIAKHLNCEVDEITGSATKRPALTNEDGLSETQNELIEVIRNLPDDAVSVLLAAAKAQLNIHKVQDDQ